MSIRIYLYHILAHIARKLSQNRAPRIISVCRVDRLGNLRTDAGTWMADQSHNRNIKSHTLVPPVFTTPLLPNGQTL